MINRSMQEIHMDSLARAAGVISPPHLTVSHAHPTSRPRKRRARKLFRSLLLRISQFCQRTADWLEVDSLTRSTAR